MSAFKSIVNHVVTLMAIGAVIGAVAKPPSRINKGRVATDDEFGAAVMLTPLRNRIPMCGGTIISPSHILTAAHCVEGIISSRIIIRAGIHDIRDNSNAVVRSVTEIITHPDYHSFIEGRRLVENDIAVLVLKEALPIGGRIRTAKLPTQKPMNGHGYLVAGWGDNAPKPKTVQYDLKVLSVRLGDEYVCGGLVPKTFCAYPDLGATCIGDSGSPLMKDGYIYGIDSTGSCLPGRRTTFVNVYDYVDWINGIIS